MMAKGLMNGLKSRCLFLSALFLLLFSSPFVLSLDSSNLTVIDVPLSAEVEPSPLLFGFDDPGSFAVRLSVMIGVIAAGIIGFFLFRLFS